MPSQKQSLPFGRYPSVKRIGVASEAMEEISFLIQSETIDSLVAIEMFSCYCRKQSPVGIGLTTKVNAFEELRVSVLPELGQKFLH